MEDKKAVYHIRLLAEEVLPYRNLFMDLECPKMKKIDKIGNEHNAFGFIKNYPFIEVLFEKQGDAESFYDEAKDLVEFCEKLKNQIEIEEIKNNALA